MIVKRYGYTDVFILFSPYIATILLLAIGVSPRRAAWAWILLFWFSSFVAVVAYGGLAFYIPRMMYLKQLCRYLMGSQGILVGWVVSTLSCLVLALPNVISYTLYGLAYIAPAPALSNFFLNMGEGVQQMLAAGSFRSPVPASFEATSSALFAYDPVHLVIETLIMYTSASAISYLGERAHQQAQASMHQAAIHKSEFVARMSHELRTPLFGIVGCLEILASSTTDTQQQSLLQMGQTCSKTLMGLIDDILDMSKLEVGKLELSIQLVETDKLIDESLEVIWSLAARKGINLRQVRKSKLPRFFLGDPTRNRQVLINLLTNSVKFTPPNGTITLFARRVPNISVRETAHTFSPNLPSASLEGKVVDGYMSFKVKDTGIGLEPEEMERIFNAFEQVDVSVARSYGGSGLGLTISASLVAQMGGKFFVSSEGKGQGATFRYFIPYIVPDDTLPLSRSDRQMAFMMNSRASLPAYIDDLSTLASGNSASPSKDPLAASSSAAASGRIEHKVDQENRGGESHDMLSGHIKKQKAEKAAPKKKVRRSSSLQELFLQLRPTSAPAIAQEPSNSIIGTRSESNPRLRRQEPVKEPEAVVEVEAEPTPELTISVTSSDEQESTPRASVQSPQQSETSTSSDPLDESMSSWSNGPSEDSSGLVSFVPGRRVRYNSGSNESAARPPPADSVLTLSSSNKSYSSTAPNLLKGFTIRRPGMLNIPPGLSPGSPPTPPTPPTPPPPSTPEARSNGFAITIPQINPHTPPTPPTPPSPSPPVSPQPPERSFVISVSQPSDRPQKLREPTPITVSTSGSPKQTPVVSIFPTPPTPSPGPLATPSTPGSSAPRRPSLAPTSSSEKPASALRMPRSASLVSPLPSHQRYLEDQSTDSSSSPSEIPVRRVDDTVSSASITPPATIEAIESEIAPEPAIQLPPGLKDQPVAILVAEDNVINQRILELMLARLGYRCHLACNGLEAVQCASAHSYLLILLDIEMPEMPGPEAARRMRAMGIRTPIVALSAHVLPEAQRMALEAGMDQFISKPVKVSTLKKVITRWLP